MLFFSVDFSPQCCTLPHLSGYERKGRGHQCGPEPESFPLLGGEKTKMIMKLFYYSDFYQAVQILIQKASEKQNCHIFGPL